ncbi:MAG: hypothetical protein HKO66_13540 [Saprospiraceae bacterium]|nr:hypothetical protein [Bacteroidia bacterium]NNE15051.1 hypothetical protein [Saprospiraceae bacterium]NNL93258.1 hypothetical protein [Saprospiraceae bacterium]
MSNKVSKSLEKLVSLFPEIAPPITISEESVIAFSSKNKPISLDLMDEYFSVWDQIDEFTEMVPCFQLNISDGYYALVYWKGSLLTYEYILITLDKNNTLISKKVIAGTISNGQTIKKSVATIDEEYCIYTAVGEQDVSIRNYIPTNSSAFKFEIEPDGTISSSQEENYLWEEENQKRKN